MVPTADADAIEVDIVPRSYTFPVDRHRPTIHAGITFNGGTNNSRLADILHAVNNIDGSGSSEFTNDSIDGFEVGF
jgi:hypothetical protein